MNKQITKNFNIAEFKCRCGECVMPQIVRVNLFTLVKQYLQPLRDEFDSPIRINSGYRCLEHNTAVGSTRHSQHILGTAADITIVGYTPKEVYDKVLELWTRVPGLGLYRNFIHIDNRNLDYRSGKPARW